VHPNNAKLISYLITGAIVLLVLFFRMRGMARGRRLRLEWLWVTPAILLLASIALIVQAPPVGLDWAWLAVVLVVGGAIGWYRGRMMRITIDPQTHALNMQASPAAIMFLVALFVIRFALRAALQTQASTWRLSPALITDAFALFALGLFGVQRIEMALRARRLLSEARAGRAAA
jgi:NAD/NADP transhydrogenase beta subunit